MFLILSAMILGVSFTAFCVYLRHRRAVLRHTERMAALEKGVALPDLEDPSQASPWTPRAYLLRGMLWLFSGAAMALMVMSFSLTFHQDRPPIGAASIGLIPMGVGLAYLIFYRKERQ
jgi:hypothetical protein